MPVALSAGVTTLITAGFEEPPWRMLRTLEAFERLPVNLGLQASARTDVPGQLEAVIEAGAVGLKIHEDWGAYPEVIDAVLRAADAHDIAVCLHTDGLNESCELEDTVEAIAGRAIHAYHVEGSGGGHIPDLIGIVREPNVFCSSTTPTIPFGPSTAAEQLDMNLIVHEGNPALPEDVAAARELVHPATMEAEGPLHDLGAISIINSDSQGMGRIGETVRRTFQLAHVMKRGARPTGRMARRRPTTTSGSSATWPRSRRSPLASTASRTRSARSRRAALADLVLWDASSLRREARRGLQGRRRRVERDRRRQRQRARRRAHAVRPRLGSHGRGTPRRSPPRSSRRRRSTRASRERSARDAGSSP